MSKELKPCPFCGSTNIELDHTDVSVVCGNCAAEGPFGDADMEVAIEAWNNRADPVVPPVLYAQIQTLRKYQAWRKGDDERTMDEAGIVPAAVTSALDAVLEIAENHLRGAEPEHSGEDHAQHAAWNHGPETWHESPIRHRHINSRIEIIPPAHETEGKQ